MKKYFTKDDYIKKYETNVKSAFGVAALGGLTALIYLIRFFIKGDFDFYFSFSSIEFFLRLGNAGSISEVLSFILAGIVLFTFIGLLIATYKNQKNFIFLLFFYLCEVAFSFGIMLYNKSITEGNIVDLIFHIFILVFITAGIYSEKKLGKE